MFRFDFSKHYESVFETRKMLKISYLTIETMKHFSKTFQNILHNSEKSCNFASQNCEKQRP